MFWKLDESVSPRGSIPFRLALNIDPIVAVAFADAVVLQTRRLYGCIVEQRPLQYLRYRGFWNARVPAIFATSNDRDRAAQIVRHTKILRSAKLRRLTRKNDEVGPKITCRLGHELIAPGGARLPCLIHGRNGGW